MYATNRLSQPCPLMLRCIALVVTATFAGPLAAQWQITGDPVPPSLAGFDSAMHTIMASHGITSAELAVTWQGRLVLAHGYSLNPGTGDIVTQPGSLMRIASNSKQITSILVNRLIQDGMLSPTDKLGQYIDLDTLPGEFADPRLANVTVRNLLEHLGGFRTYDGIRDPMFADAQIAADSSVSLPVSQANIIRAMNGVPLATNPGTTFWYSNYGYLLLGRIIEAASGMNYADYAMSIFRPIGIHDMRLGHSLLAQRAPGEVAYRSGIQRTSVMDNSGALVPYEYGAFNIENMDSHGGWIMSAVELARIASNLDNPSAPGAILNAASLQRMFGLPQNYPGPYVTGDPYYAQGWSVRDYGDGNRNTWHDGSLPGTTSYMVRTGAGWDFVAILNRRDETGQANYAAEIDNAMWNVRGQITNAQWPSNDLFPILLPWIFSDGFDDR